jgi:nitrogen regulatory protein P-II 1
MSIKVSRVILIRISAILSNNDVMSISEALKKLEIGGLTVSKPRGRGKTPPPEIHAGKGSAIFTPQFSQKYLVQVFTSANKEKDVINIIKKNSRRGKILVEPVSRAIDIATGKEGENVI